MRACEPEPRVASREPRAPKKPPSKNPKMGIMPTVYELLTKRKVKIRLDVGQVFFLRVYDGWRRGRGL